MRKISLEGMKRNLFISIASCIMAMAIQAETIRVLRFVHVDGTESEVAQNSLQKVVFTRSTRYQLQGCVPRASGFEYKELDRIQEILFARVYGLAGNR